MRVLIALLALAVPSVVFAQPSDPPAGPPAPPSTPEPPPPAPAVAPPLYQQPPPTYGPPQYVAAPFPFHSGVTFEANLGFGVVHITDSNSSISLDTDVALAGLDLGVGGWLNPNLALTVRAAGVDVRINGSGSTNGTVIAGFLGPTLQYWTNNNFWLGGGAGLAVLAAIRGCSSNCSNNGFGLDLRMGYAFTSGSANTFNVSLELTPGFYGNNNGSSGGGSATGVAVLAGYQFL